MLPHGKSLHLRCQRLNAVRRHPVPRILCIRGITRRRLIPSVGISRFIAISAVDDIRFVRRILDVAVELRISGVKSSACVRLASPCGVAHRSGLRRDAHTVGAGLPRAAIGVAKTLVGSERGTSETGAGSQESEDSRKTT